MKRLYYLDNLMICLSILVVLHHVSIAYGTMGGWCYVTSEKLPGTAQIFLSTITGLEASFSMSLFFFISAFLTIPSLEKKGVSRFIKGRLIRLVVPLLFVMIIFAPSILYFIEIHNQTTQLSWFNYVLQQNTKPYTSHVWFILVLIIFELVYIAYWKFIKPHFSISKSIPDNIPTHINILAVILLCGGLTLIVRQFFPLGQNFIGIEFSNITPYIFMYALGLLVFRKHWLDDISRKVAIIWFPISLIAAAYFCVIIYLLSTEPTIVNKFVSGITWESVSLSFAQVFLCIGFCGFFLHLFNKKLNATNSTLSIIRENRYGVYIFHSAVVVGVTIMLESLMLKPSVKYIIACILSIVFSFMFVGLIRKIPLVKRVI
ncbi:acyltransferase family protein [Emticicia sp. BO119]|uniref:acyltransferase family protein n=1 Tax=Emticicia sp. BO119 TaxID=2757768 RepID=UPI0015EFF57A|nr:acyltransferase family protein [Emticicia sp. BO119]MBA4851326.1 acyltransferase family protein [Emticicia sp. BO119]